jgi:peptidyl-prolyl cis-trans isomerase B (cyclophilin B)
MQLKFSQFLVAFLLIGSLMLAGCNAQEVGTNSSPASTTAVETTTTTSAEATSVSQTNSESNPGMNNSLPRLEGKATVVITVKGAPITVEVDGTNAPITAGNFVDLVQKGVYDGTVFHRVVRQPQPFVVQGGDPQSKDPKSNSQLWGTGGYVDSKTNTERRIPLEIKPKGEATPLYSKTFESANVTKPPQLQHKQGAVAMARSQQPDSASSQFYFALADLGFLDGNYAVFGYVTQGFDVVNNIQQGDRIDSARVTQGAENFKAAQ